MVGNGHLPFGGYTCVQCGRTTAVTTRICEECGSVPPCPQMPHNGRKRRARKQHGTLALCHFANDWHSGFQSRGYRILSAAVRRAKRFGMERPIDKPLKGKSLQIYNRLTRKYRNSI